MRKDIQSHTYYVGKPIIIQQQNRVVKKKGAQRRRDQQPEAPEAAKEAQCGLMSDLNDFMMCEDLKINEQEEKFIEQTRKNKRNIGSFEDEVEEEVFDFEEEEKKDEETESLNLQTQIKNIDLIFEPEPELAQT